MQQDMTNCRSHEVILGKGGNLIILPDTNEWGQWQGISWFAASNALILYTCLWYIHTCEQNASHQQWWHCRVKTMHARKAVVYFYGERLRVCSIYIYCWFPAFSSIHTTWQITSIQTEVAHTGCDIDHLCIQLFAQTIFFQCTRDCIRNQVSLTQIQGQGACWPSRIEQSS